MAEAASAVPTTTGGLRVELAEAASVVPTTTGGLRVEFPDIKLDASRCHRRCRISQDGRCLENKTCTDYPSPSAPFKFLGTCGTEALPNQNCYWQVRFKAESNSDFVHGTVDCEVGVAPMEALERVCLFSRLSETERLATAVEVDLTREKFGTIYVAKCSFTDKDPTYYHHGASVPWTLGFLLMVSKKTLAILDVTGEVVICEKEVDVSQPLWPFFNLVYENDAEVNVTLQVEKGEGFTLTPKIAELIRPLMEESG